MAINKKRIAERQRAAAKANKQAKYKRVQAIVLYSVLVTLAVVVFATAFILILNGNKTTYADIVIQDYGMITVELDPEAAPISCKNFVELAESGFYNGLTFHRIIEGFMMQGGAPNSDSEEPKNIKGEFSANGWDNPISHTAGVISMARAQAYNSGSSQFFIVHKDSPHLDGQYAAFGRVVAGMDVVNAVCETAEPTDDNGSIAKDAQPIITSVTIRTK